MTTSSAAASSFNVTLPSSLSPPVSTLTDAITVSTSRGLLSAGITTSSSNTGVNGSIDDDPLWLLELSLRLLELLLLRFFELSLLVLFLSLCLWCPLCVDFEPEQALLLRNRVTFSHPSSASSSVALRTVSGAGGTTLPLSDAELFTLMIGLVRPLTLSAHVSPSPVVFVAESAFPWLLLLLSSEGASTLPSQEQLLKSRLLAEEGLDRMMGLGWVSVSIDAVLAILLLLMVDLVAWRTGLSKLETGWSFLVVSFDCLMLVRGRDSFGSDGWLCARASGWWCEGVTVWG